MRYLRKTLTAVGALLLLLSFSTCGPAPPEQPGVTPAETPVDAGLTLSAEQIKRQFGIVGDGKTNDTRGLQAYLDYATERGEPVVLPAGDFLIDELVYEAKNVHHQNVIVRGQGFTTRLIATGNKAYALRLIGRSIQLRDLEVDGNQVPTGRAANGVYMSNNFNMSGADRIRVNNFRNGTAFHLGTPNWTLQFNSCEFRGSRVALRIGDDQGVDPVAKKLDRIGSGNMLTFQGCSIAGSDTSVVIGRPDNWRASKVPQGFSAISFYGCNLSATNRIVVAHGVNDNLLLDGCYIERNKKREALDEVDFVYFDVAEMGNFVIRGAHMKSSCLKVIRARYCESVVLEDLTSNGNGLTMNKHPDATYFDLTNVRRTIVRNTQINKRGPGYIFTVHQVKSIPEGLPRVKHNFLMDIVIDNSRIRCADGKAWNIDAERIGDLNVYLYGADTYGLRDELYQNYKVRQQPELEKVN